jgi:hypothetical protein
MDDVKAAVEARVGNEAMNREREETGCGQHF